MSIQIEKKLLKEVAIKIYEIAKKEKITSQDKLNRIKKNISKEYGLKKAPTNIELLNSLPAAKRGEYSLFTTKPVRTSAGVAVVAIMSYPYECPHGKCTTCPGGPKSHFGDVPQSYTGTEPATKRAARNNFDPYLQVMNRLEQYVVINQIPEKIELIIMGGTFPSFEKSYQTNFVKSAFKAMNDFSKEFFIRKKLPNGKIETRINKDKFVKFFELPGDIENTDREKRVMSKLKKLKNNHRTKANNTNDLEYEQKRNENSYVKCVGLTVETRPDYADLKIGNFLLNLGTTRIELGIQSLDNKVLKKINRGHSVEDSINSIKTLKDIGFKLNFHFMLGLPSWSEKKDIEGLKQLFTDDNFKPDMLKIYPCMVMPGTELYKDYKAKIFKPISTKQAAKVIYDFKPFVPEYCRIMRVQRDIPTNQTIAGVDKTNLRQIVDQMKPTCRCIRCREISRKIGPAKNVKIIIREYQASEGKEIFISAEDEKLDAILGFTRLRFPNQSLRKEITNSSALIRELHVYGTQTSIGTKGNKKSSQHKGYGKQLLEKAESIAKQNGKDKMIIISGIGVRNYYRKLGYKKQGPYMIKKI